MIGKRIRMERIMDRSSRRTIIVLPVNDARHRRTEVDRIRESNFERGKIDRR